jgi:hypothetical protein
VAKHPPDQPTTAAKHPPERSPTKTTPAAKHLPEQSGGKVSASEERVAKRPPTDDQRNPDNAEEAKRRQVHKWKLSEESRADGCHQ